MVGFVWRIVDLYGEMTGDDGMTNSAVLGYLHTPLYVSSVSQYVMYICQYSDKMEKKNTSLGTFLKYHSLGTFPKFHKKIVERDKIMPLTHKYTATHSPDLVHALQ